MAIKAKFNIDKLFERVYARVEDIQDAVIQAIELACLDTVKKARNLPSLSEELRNIPHQPNYIDDSGLLRGSIGFVIYDHGKKVTDNFEARNGEKGSEGAALGKGVAEQAAASWPNCIVAVVVAGADYALYVESKGYDVISGPCNELNGLLEQHLAQAVASFK